MSLLVSGGAAPATTPPLMDFIEDFGQFGALPAGGSPTASVRIVNLATGGADVIFPNDQPMAGSFAGQTFVLGADGLPVIDFTMVAAVELTHNVAAGGRLYCLPMSKRAAAIGIPQAGPALRYTLTVPVRRTVAGARSFGVFASERNNFLGFNNSGLMWECAPGGFWTARRRTLDAGPLVQVQVSSVPMDTTWRNIGLRYTEGAVPSWDWLIDGAVIATEQGDATVPIHSLNPGRMTYHAGTSLSGIVDPDRFQLGPCRWTVELA